MVSGEVEDPRQTISWIVSCPFILYVPFVCIPDLLLACFVVDFENGICCSCFVVVSHQLLKAAILFYYPFDYLNLLRTKLRETT